MLMGSLSEPLNKLIEQNNQGELVAYLRRVTNDERLLIIQLCRADGTPLVNAGAALCRGELRLCAPRRCPKPRGLDTGRLAPGFALSSGQAGQR